MSNIKQFYGFNIEEGLKRFKLNIIDEEVEFIEQNENKKSEYAKVNKLFKKEGVELYRGFLDGKYRYFGVLCRYDSKFARSLANKFLNKTSVDFFILRSLVGKSGILFIFASTYSKNVLSYVKEKYKEVMVEK